MADVSLITDVADINIFSKTGSVLDVQLTSETEIHSSSSGGGGWVGPGGGNVSAPTVSIRGTSHERAHIFLRQDNGREMEIDIRDSGIGIRTGHRLSAIYAGPKSGDTGHLAALLNHDTGKWMIYDYRMEWLVKRAGPGMAFLLLAALPVSGCYAGGIVGGGINMAAGDTTIFTLMPGVLFLAGLAFGIVRLRRAKAGVEAIKAAIKGGVHDEINRLSQQAIAESVRPA